MQQLKFNNTISSSSELSKRKSQLMDELLSKKEIKELVEKLDVSINEFDYYLGYFLSYYEDKCCCNNCENIDKCSKEIKGMVLNLVRNEDNTIEREYSLCKKKEEQRRILTNYIIRDFNDDLLKIDLDNIENKKGRFKYEKMIMEIDLDTAREGMYIHGPSNSGKSYPLIALCNEFVKNNKKCAFVEVKNFLDSLKSTFDSKDNKDGYNDLMNDVKNVDVLVLDGLGEETPSVWVRDTVISSILDYRNKNNLLTFITSCYTIDEIQKMYNVSNSNSDISRLKTEKFIEKIKSVCPNIISIGSK